MSKLTFPLKWSGVYEYDYIPLSDLTPEPVSFELFLQFTSSTDFMGQVRDDPSSSMPEPGKVSGKLTGNRIEFVKQMPIATYTEANGESLKFDNPHPDIFYSGEYIADENLMIGTWQIKPVSPGILEHPGASGTWHADAVNSSEEDRTQDRGAG